ncbi:9786_t:CDS:2, partial [Entrophospora sp. SA101]
MSYSFHQIFENTIESFEDITDLSESSTQQVGSSGSTTNTLKHLEREHGLIRPEISTKFMQNMSDDCAAIVSLCDSMCEDVDREVRENGRKLKKILLKDNEWLFLENFVRILKDFDDITKLFSSRDFVSLSLVYPTIRVLIEKVKKINTNNTNINTEYDDEYIPPIDDHDLLTELESYNDEQGESPLVEEIGLILSVLDPRFKHLKFLQENEKDHIYNLISNKLNEKKNNH